MKSLDKLVKSIAVAAGLGIGMLGISTNAQAQCPGPFVSDEKSVVWHFDENQGSETIGEFRGQPSNFHATIYNRYGAQSSELWSSGMFGSSGLKFHLPSSMAVEDRGILFQKGPGLTIEAYMNQETQATDQSGYQCIVTQGSFKFGVDKNGKLFLNIREPSTTPLYYSYEEFHGNAQIEPGKFTYVAFTYNGGNILEFYINGSLDSELLMFNSTSLGPIWTVFGAAGTDAEHNTVAQFNGTIDEVRITDCVREFTPCGLTPVAPTTWGKLKAMYK